MSGSVTSQIDTYSWVRPAFPAPAPEAEWSVLDVATMASFLEDLPKGSKVAFDTETTGLRYWVPGVEMKSISVFAPDDGGSLCVASLVGETQESISALLHSLTPHNLYAFNAQFDMGVLVATNRALPKKLRVDEEALLAAMSGCSQVLFRHCTNEGFNVHSLEMAQRNLFGWDDGAQKAWLAEALEAKGLTKAEMWRLLEHEDTREGFLYYNAMDARSAWLVWDHLCNELRRLGREGAIALHEQEFATLIRDCVRQAFTGMPLDRKKMREILIASARKKAEIHTALRNDPRILPFIEQWEKEKIYEQWRLDVERRTKKLSDAKIVNDALAGYSVIDDQAEAMEAEEVEEEGKGITSKLGPTEVDASGQLLTPYYKASLKGGNRFPGFSFSSTDHLKDLLYGHLSTHRVAYTKKRGPEEIIRWGITPDGSDKEFVVAATDSGDLPTGADIYPVFGDIGKKLEEAAEADTRFGFAKSYLAAASETKKVHAQLKPHGAGTGRCSGGSGGKNKSSLSVNVQQLCRGDREFMECFVAPKGMLYLSRDFKGLEKVVQAELSGDPVLTRLYASGEEHDVHLYHTMMIHPDARVRAEISARYALDKDVLSKLKKEFKKERDFGKMASFAFDYGSSAENIYIKSNIAGIPTTMEDAEAAHRGYRNLYSVYYAWCEEKKKEWEARGGWIEDGFGFPIAIAPYPLDKKGYPAALKDAGSKIVQRTGHYILMTWLKHLERIKRERKLWDLERPVICDLHDERISLVPEDRLDECHALQQEALDCTNDELNPTIRFEMVAEWGPTLYDTKKQ